MGNHYSNSNPEEYTAPKHEYYYHCKVRLVTDSGDGKVVVSFIKNSTGLGKNVAMWEKRLFEAISEDSYYDVVVIDGVVSSHSMSTPIRNMIVKEVSLTPDPEYNKVSDINHDSVLVPSKCKIVCEKHYSFFAEYDISDRLVATKILDSESNLILG